MTLGYDGLTIDQTLKNQVRGQSIIPKGCTVLLKG